MEEGPFLENLSQEGWNLSLAGLALATEKGVTADTNQIVKKLLDLDLRSVSKGSLPEDINKTKYESIQGGIVLQVQKVKNLSSPKYKESHNVNPTILKIVLTDGVQNVQAVTIDSIPSLNMNTYPGSKIMLTGDVEISHCLLLLKRDNTTFLGGRVNHMIEKWDLNRSLAKHKRDNQEEGGPPPWIPFGQKIANQVLTDKNFKSLDQGKNKEVTENSEFEAQRKGAIMEASKIVAPKVFGGGNNKLLDHNVQVIVSAGFSVEQAEWALKISKNNPDRALRSLMTKTTKPGERGENSGRNNKPEDKGAKSGGGKGRGRHRDDDGPAPLKPSGKVSLFAFLEDKLPTSGADKESTFDSRNTADKKFIKPKDDRKPGADFRSKGTYDKRSSQDRRSDTVKFDSKRTYDGSRTDKSFGNFKEKHETTFSKHESNRQFRNSEKRDTGSKTASGTMKSYYGKNDKTMDGSHGHDDSGASARKSNFVPNNEKPPRFQKYQQQNQQNEITSPHWNDTSTYPKIPPQTDFQIQNSLANLSLQQNAGNYGNQNSHEFIGPPNGNKNVYYQNMVIPSTQSTETQRQPPPVAQPVPGNSFQARNTAGFQPDLKNSPYPGLPNIPEYPFKGVPGFNDFQAVFGRSTNNYSANNYDNAQNNYSNTPSSFNNTQNTYNSASSYNNTPNSFGNSQNTYNAQNSYNNPVNTAINLNNFGSAPPPNAVSSYSTNAPQFIPPAQMLQAPPPVQSPQTAVGRRWAWKKGQKCMARYWEDQQFYSAIITAVSESTCVVRFTEYGNYEEVLHDDCLPFTDMQPET